MMVDKINKLYESGAKLFISGRPATPVMVLQHVAGRISNCMPTFYYDEKGRLTELHF